MNKFLSVQNILILLLGVGLLFKTCGGPSDDKKETIRVDGKKYEVIKTIVDTLEVVKTKVEYKAGKDIYHEVVKEVHIPQNIDTLKVITDYFSKRVYKDTLKLPDNLGNIFLLDTISQNKIFSRSFTANVKQRVVNNTTIVKDLPRTQVYWGLGASFNKTDFIHGANIGLLLKTKKDNIYQLGVGVSNSLTNTNPSTTVNPYISAGIYWKIRLKK